MKIFSAEQIKQWDTFTINSQGISSLDLMERAAEACCAYLVKNHSRNSFSIFCGKGNNGGDGLAIARLLIQNNFPVRIFVLGDRSEGSADFDANITRILGMGVQPCFLTSSTMFPTFEENELIIDAMLGTGLRGIPEGLIRDAIIFLNGSNKRIISIDLPSGSYCDKSTIGQTVIEAEITLSFSQKLSFLVAENQGFNGQIILLDIGLDKKFETDNDTPWSIPEPESYCQMVLPRKAFSNKGDYGHGALISGSKGMMGACILASRAYLQSGAGKLTCHVPACGYEIMQTSVPEAMCSVSGNDHLKLFSDSLPYQALGIGPGMGTSPDIYELLAHIFRTFKGKLVLDADALNVLAQEKSLWQIIPNYTILTPHPGEFDRLFGKAQNDFERLQIGIEAAQQFQIFIILKGHRSAVMAPDGKVSFNCSGNAGMAKPGMGDVLTGLITGLLCQGYDPKTAATLGVYLHGLAGDFAAEALTQQAMTATDLILHLEKAWKAVTR